MYSFRAKVGWLVTVVAVLLVSATCTSAGCLLQANVSASAAGTPAMACCAAHLAHSGEKIPADPSDHHCPLCQHSVVLAKAIDQCQHDFSPTILPCEFCVVSQAFSAQPSFRLAFAHGDMPPDGPCTLLDLHCALLI